MGKGKALECGRGGSFVLLSEVTAYARAALFYVLTLENFLTVHILLFTTSNVVLLLMLTIRTVFSGQRLHTLTFMTRLDRHSERCLSQWSFGNEFRQKTPLRSGDDLAVRAEE